MLIHRPCQPAGSQRGPSQALPNDAHRCAHPAAASLSQPHPQDPVASNNALWKGAQQALALNLTRAIGVSNYATADLKALEGATPRVNQCQMSIQNHDDDTIAYCAAHGIVYESYQATGMLHAPPCLPPLC